MDTLKDLIIVCAGGFGKETLFLVEKINAHCLTWNILGFIDDTIPVGTEVYHGYRVIGGIKDLEPNYDAYYAIGISTPAAKEKLYNILKDAGLKLATLVSPSIILASETEVGEGTIITSGSISCNVKLGKCVNIAGSMVGDSEIGDFSTTTGYANIAGARLGKRVFVGSHAVVLNGRKVGDDAFICAGSICFSHVKPGTKVFGNPATKIDI